MRYQTAIFWISEGRFFKEATAVGVDADILRRKSIQFCQFFQFDLYDGRKFKVARVDFERESWIYPPGEDSHYKANRSEFVQKRMLALEKVIQLHNQNRERESLEILKLAMI